MSSRKSSLAFASIVAVCSGMFTAPAAHAALGGPSGVLIPYRGYLEQDGAPVDSTEAYTFHFTLYDAQTGGNVCPNEYDATAPVSAGQFSVVVGPVNPTCVIGKPVFLAVSVRGPSDGSFLAMQGRQRVYPSLGALTAGQGDFDVSAGNVTANGVQVNGDTNVVGTTNTGALIITSGTGRIVMGDRPIQLRGAGDPNHGVGYRNSFGGASFDGPAVYGWTGGVLGTNEGGERAALQWNSSRNVTVGGNLTVGASGGNVAHACVTRRATSATVAACAAGEIAVGGGATCSSTWRITDSRPSHADGSVPGNGTAATAWYAICQVWGDAAFYAPPQGGVYAICCRQ